MRTGIVVAMVLACVACAGPTRSAPSTPSVTVPQSAPDCAPDQLVLALVDGVGFESRLVFELQALNQSSHWCSLQGAPTLSLINAAGKPVGAPSESAGSPAPPVLIQPGSKAVAGVLYQKTITLGSGCRPVETTKVSVTIAAKHRASLLDKPLTACADGSIQLLTVTPFVVH